MAHNPVTNTELLQALAQAKSVRGAGRLLGINQTVYYVRAARFPEVREGLQRLRSPEVFRHRSVKR